MSKTADYTTRCTECNKYIITGLHTIEKLHAGSRNWVHSQCYIDYWERVNNKWNQQLQQTSQ